MKALPRSLLLASLLLCGARAPGLRSARSPLADEVFVDTLGVSGDVDLAISQLLHIVGVGRPTLVALLGRCAGLQFHGSQLAGDQSRTCPKVIGLFGEEVPAEDGELAGDGDGGDLMTASGSDAEKEGVKGPWGLGRRPGRFDQHRTGVRPSLLADAAMLRQTETGLPHARIEPDIAHELFRAGEPADIADRRDDTGSHRQIDAGDGRQPFHGGIVHRRLGDLAVEHGQVLAQPVELALVALDRGCLVLGHGLAGQPVPPQPPNRSA